jgi:hypothetical protein
VESARGFTRLNHRVRVRTKGDNAVLRPFLPDRHSPLQPNGNSNQSIYLTELSRELAEVLAGLIGVATADESGLQTLHAL